MVVINRVIRPSRFGFAYLAPVCRKRTVETGALGCFPGGSLDDESKRIFIGLINAISNYSDTNPRNDHEGVHLSECESLLPYRIA
jgi:hypothetical protein